MKTLKYILIAIVAIPLLFIAPAAVAFIGTATFLGIVILGALESIGIVKIKNGNTNKFLIISAIIGGVLLLFYLIATKD